MQNVVFCSALPRSPRVPFPVSECSTYDDQRLPSLDAMRQIAWEVKSRNRGPVGFASDQKRMEIVITPPETKYDQPDRVAPPANKLG